ncbi:MAG: Stp1/IreP family PP2C-type Ser/Thr phosphatase [Actinomycetota bacterium]
MKATVAAATDIGKVRSGNEDAYLVEVPLIAVADGMGGHQGGEVASHLALETIETLFKHQRGTLAEQVAEANHAVHERSLRDASVSGMGTTLTAAVADGDRLRLAHVGDSRAYLVRDGELRSLTEDHTMVREMELRGELTAEEASAHPHRSVLTRAIGTDSDVRVDEGIVDLVDGDRLLLCTDGLTGMVDDDRILAVLRDTPDPSDAVRILVREANENGGVDNVTAVIVDFSGEPGRAASAPGPATGATRVSTSTMPDRGPTPPPPPAGGAKRRSFPLGKVAIWVGVFVLVLVVALVGTRLYLDRQWYVGVEGDKVAIFRGVPSELLGFDLSSPAVVTPVTATQAQQLQFFSGLAEGISVSDRAAADEIVRQIEQDLAELERQQEQQDANGTNAGGGNQNGGGGGGGAQPDARPAP